MLSFLESSVQFEGLSIGMHEYENDTWIKTPHAVNKLVLICKELQSL